MMRELIWRAHLCGTWLMLVLIIVQFTAAGAGVFSGPRTKCIGSRHTSVPRFWLTFQWPAWTRRDLDALTL